MALNLRDGDKWLRGTVIQQLAINVYNVHIHDIGVVWKRHANQLLLNRIPPSKTEFNLDKDNISDIRTPLLNRNELSLSNDIPIDNESPNLSNSYENSCPQIIQNPDSNMSKNHSNLNEDSPPLRRSQRTRKPIERYGF